MVGFALVAAPTLVLLLLLLLLHSVEFALVALVPVLDSALAVVRGGPTADKYPTLRTYVPLSVCLSMHSQTTALMTMPFIGIKQTLKQ